MADVVAPTMPGAVPPGADRVTSFGRALRGRTTVAPLDAGAVATTRGITRGSGCSYGDQAWCSGGLSWTAPVDVRIGTDEVDVGGGVVLRDLLRDLWPLGRTLAVLPGSLAVTVGGAIAADVHGKNHASAGTFGHHVLGLDLVTPSGRRAVGPEDEAFRATTGGMGLTGTIERARLATVPLASTWATHTTTPVTGVTDLLATMEAARADHEHVAAWLDLVAPHVRGIVEATTVDVDGPRTDAMLPSPPTVRVPPLPTSLVRRGSIRVANAARFRLARSATTRVPLTSALFPLESVGGFPHVYGPTGFVQHQVVVPDGHDDVLVDVVACHRELPIVPALAVLKWLGDAGPGHLSFPRRGWTLAVDLPASGPGLGDHLDAIDQRVAAVGGRVYLAKDATAAPGAIAAMYPRLAEWRRVADDLDPDHLVTSDLDRRLGLRRPGIEVADA